MNSSIEKRVFLVSDKPSDCAVWRNSFPKLIFTAFSKNRFAFARQVVSLALAKRIDLLLIGHINYAPLGLLAKCIQPSLRYGVMVHGIDVWNRLPIAKRYALRKANFITSVSEYTKQKAITVNQADAARTYVLPNTIEDREITRPDHTNKSLADGPRLLSVCRLSADERYKGVDTVIKALPALIEKVPDVQYFIVGNGSDLDRHKRLATECSVVNRIHFLGNVDNDTLDACYHDCDIFVMPSASEGFGIVFLEAMRHSKPVVAARSGGTPEVVLDNVTGHLVEYGDVHALADTLIELCLDPEKRQRLGDAGYQRLQEKFVFGHFQTKFTEIVTAVFPSAREFSKEVTTRPANRQSELPMQ